MQYPRKIGKRLYPSTRLVQGSTGHAMDKDTDNKTVPRKARALSSPPVSELFEAKLGTGNKVFSTH